MVENETYHGCFSIITLKELDADLVRLFLRILEEKFFANEVPIDNKGIAGGLLEVATLFSRINDKTNDLIGLWGELYFISHFADREGAAKRWSKRKTAKFDFVSKQFALDVKTTVGTQPVHRFSLEQLRPTGDFDVYICSLCLVEMPGGCSVGELMDEIANSITDSGAKQSFLEQCVSKAGADLYRSELKLQTYPRRGSMAIYKASEIPAPEVPERSSISRVRFNVNLSDVVALDSNEAKLEHILGLR